VRYWGRTRSEFGGRKYKMRKPSHVVVCGAGVIGCSVAYYLTQRGLSVLLIDKADVAAAASGKAGGFLARDWCDGTPTQELSRLSFDLHQELAELFGHLTVGYRSLNALSASLPLRERALVSAHAKQNRWLGQNCFVRGEVGNRATTAQVDPFAFTKALFDAALANGARFKQATVTDIIRSPEGDRIEGLRIPGETIATSAVVVAMGPWTCEAERWLPLDSIDAIKTDSIVFESVPELPPTALFVDVETPQGTWESLEIFPRPDGSVYVCGGSDNELLPESPWSVHPQDPTGADLAALATEVVPALDGRRPIRVNACFRPVTRSGSPTIGPIPGVSGGWLATGHGPWGILNAPATGLAVSEIIVDGVCRSLDLDGLLPGVPQPTDAEFAATAQLSR